MYTEASTQQTERAEPRRGRAARGRARRELLLDATLRLIAERGVAAVSHRAVAELAGVPLGSTTYWFASRQEMLREALEHFIRSEIDDLRRRLGGVLGARPAPERLVDEFTACLLPQLGEERWRTVAQYALLAEAVHEPALERLCRDWNEAWIEVLAEVFSELGAPRPELDARGFLALMDGVLLGQLAAPDEDPEALIRPLLEAWFARLPYAGGSDGGNPARRADDTERRRA